MNNYLNVFEELNTLNEENIVEPSTAFEPVKGSHKITVCGVDFIYGNPYDKEARRISRTAAERFTKQISTFDRTANQAASFSKWMNFLAKCLATSNVKTKDRSKYCIGEINHNVQRNNQIVGIVPFAGEDWLIMSMTQTKRYAIPIED